MQSEVEQHAERVLAEVPDWIWDGKSLPVPVEHIADTWFGLHVRDVEDLRTAPGVPALPSDAVLSGLLLPAAAEIWVNAGEARQWPPRRRFTIGHELGHWCLHREGGAVWCRAHAVDPDAVPDEPRLAYPPEESQANEFAASLLMPAALVRQHYERLRKADPGELFTKMCSSFGASGAAMGRRLNRVI